MLSALDPAWSAAASVAWVVAAQGIAGVAKDLTKTASKTAIKATSDQGSGQLFRWVAWFTGSKNAMKGVGFFVGGLLLQLVGFRPALWLMAGVLAVICVGVLLSLPRQLGKAKSSKTFRELFAKSRASTCWPRRASSCSARATSGSSSACRCSSTRAAGTTCEVAGFLAAWTIGYGGIQALAPPW